MKKNTLIMLKTKYGTLTNISYKRGAIVLNSDDMSAQWGADSTAVQVFNFDDHIKLTLTTASVHNGQEVQNHQSFYFEPETYSAVCEFFRSLGFPDQCFYNLALVA